ncbi:MAG: sulfatase-like hydrolase/transferase [Gammaproteobacteria bacterium]|nr:sulfatase-like hydrolase/transferase [Gammaproteobacteria bacterium]
MIANQLVNQPADFSPSVTSPLWLLQKPVAGNQNGMGDFELIKDIDPSKFISQKTGEIPLSYQSFKGAAKEKNLVFFVMESVRRRNLGLYGYSREPMPALTQLAENSLVFQNAYVMQPTSSKAMSALALGIMPDPRLIPLSWESHRIDGHETFLRGCWRKECDFIKVRPSHTVVTDFRISFLRPLTM